MQLPDFIQKAIANNTTSLGSHPAFPPDEEESFISSVIKRSYSEVMENLGDCAINEVGDKLSQLVKQCIEMEEPSRQALEKLCMDVCTEIFDIPDDTVSINLHLVNACDMSAYRMVPSPTKDLTFDDIEDMRNLSDCIYQRRMVDALISGAALSFATNLEYYIKQVYSINPKLIPLYEEIIKYNNILLFNQRDSIRGMEKNNSGKVDVNVPSSGNRISIDAEGIIFPVLLEYTIRGILEMASLRGLPADTKRAEYIMSKADYRLAENWDMRLGLPLWRLLEENFQAAGYDIQNVGVNFIIMEIASLKPNIFNTYLQNCFKKTKKGVEMSDELCSVIEYNKEQDSFDNFIKTQNSKAPINDNAVYTSEELLSEVE